MSKPQALHRKSAAAAGITVLHSSCPTLPDPASPYSTADQSFSCGIGGDSFPQTPANNTASPTATPTICNRIDPTCAEGVTAFREEGGQGGDLRAVTSGISGVDGSGGGGGSSPRDVAAGKQESVRFFFAYVTVFFVFLSATCSCPLESRESRAAYSSHRPLLGTDQG